MMLHNTASSMGDDIAMRLHEIERADYDPDVDTLVAIALDDSTSPERAEQLMREAHALFARTVVCERRGHRARGMGRSRPRSARARRSTASRASGSSSTCSSGRSSSQPESEPAIATAFTIEDHIRRIVRDEIEARLADIDSARYETALIDVREAARRLGMSVSYVRKRIRDGHLPASKVGNRHRIEPRHLERLRSPRKAPGDEAAIALQAALERLGVRRPTR